MIDKATIHKMNREELLLNLIVQVFLSDRGCSKDDDLALFSWLDLDNKKEKIFI